jgi:ParB family transcriptional regulator, chromosome partitioning protein
MADGGRSRGGLGRGLGALIPVGVPGLVEVEVDQIGRNPQQPRQQIDPEELRELADSIRTHGLLQPLVVTQVAGEPDRYQLIAGERRLQAAKLAGMPRVPVLVREATPLESLELALVENLQRSDLTPLEAAAAYQRLVDDFGLTQEEIAAKVGKSRPSIANTIRLLALPDDVKQSLARGEITEGHARAILGLRDDREMRLTTDAVVRGKLSVRATEQLVRDRAEAKERREADHGAQEEIRAVEDALRAALGTRVSLTRRGEGGQLTIYFYSEEQLQVLYDLLVK